MIVEHIAISIKLELESKEKQNKSHIIQLEVSFTDRAYSKHGVHYSSTCQGGKKELFTGWAILYIFAQKYKKTINWVGSFQFWVPWPK